jgi:hypothetical protein
MISINLRRRRRKESHSIKFESRHLDSYELNDLFRLQLREQDHVADAFLAEEHHAQAVNAHAHAAGGRHSVFERDEKILVQLLLLAAGLMFEAFALLDGIVLLGVGGRDLLAVDAALEDFDGRRGRRAKVWRAARVPWADV